MNAPPKIPSPLTERVQDEKSLDILFAPFYDSAQINVRYFGIIIR